MVLSEAADRKSVAGPHHEPNIFFSLYSTHSFSRNICILCSFQFLFFPFISPSVATPLIFCCLRFPTAFISFPHHAFLLKSSAKTLEQEDFAFLRDRFNSFGFLFIFYLLYSDEIFRTLTRFERLNLY